MLTGGEETVRLARPQTCPICRGSGAKPGTSPRRCEPCAATGQRTTSRREGNVTVKQIATCASCAGRGELIDQPCPECGGRGEAAREETLTVKIPAGIDEGTALRIPGRGLPSRERG
ncbi:MAG: J domain-containing protein, partial [Candidatus Rokubacteria bacterium]|nr:J domain-containing protein [Candidatus Rokubacteria bacterium]